MTPLLCNTSLWHLIGPSPTTHLNICVSKSFSLPHITQRVIRLCKFKANGLFGKWIKDLLDVKDPKLFQLKHSKLSFSLSLSLSLSLHIPRISGNSKSHKNREKRNSNSHTFTKTRRKELKILGLSVRERGGEGIWIHSGLGVADLAGKVGTSFLG